MSARVELKFEGGVLQIVVPGADAERTAPEAIGAALDELVLFALREGATEQDMRERLEQSFDYAESKGSAIPPETEERRL